ncbi:MAG: patatin-like phospholipase family protein [Candidatus Obscuribacterales bacterium]|jgi:hypothetical protein|nr:patatin-like phospholipase family protein [Candidatus Obscuribacterales bacterium]
MNSASIPQFDLVLGSGGIKGFGHLGLLKAIEEKQIRINRITGVSIGAIVAAFFANGFNHLQIKDILIEESNTVTFGGHPFKLLFKGFLQGGINLRSHAERITNRYQLTPRDGLYILSFDVRSMKPVFFQGTEYNLAEAVASSAAVPFFMRPILHAGHLGRKLLVDGACYHPYPTTHCKGRTIISKIGQARYLPTRKMTLLDFLIQLGDIATGSIFSRPVLAPDHFLVDVGMPDMAGLCFNQARSRFEDMIEYGYRQSMLALNSALHNVRA